MKQLELYSREGKNINKFKDKPVVYVDMDGVLVDYNLKMEDYKKDLTGRFLSMKPLNDAIKAFKTLYDSGKYDIYILTSVPWGVPTARIEKFKWVIKYLGEEYAYKRLITSNNKSLNSGAYLIDDRVANGANEFNGEHIHFGTGKFPDWASVLDYLNVDYK